MTKEELKAKLESIKSRMWMLEMADYICGSEKIEYERLEAERNELKTKLKEM